MGVKNNLYAIHSAYIHNIMYGCVSAQSLHYDYSLIFACSLYLMGAAHCQRPPENSLHSW